MLLIICNVPNQEVAQEITLTLLKLKLVACVNQLPMVQSSYYWNGNLESEAEIPLLLKTTVEQYDAIEQKIQELHPYETPEIIAIKIDKALPAYLNWVKASIL